MAGKTGLLMALGMPKGKSGAVDDDAEADTGSEAKRSAAQSLIDAVKSGRADAVVTAFESLYEACQAAKVEPGDGYGYEDSNDEED